MPLNIRSRSQTPRRWLTAWSRRWRTSQMVKFAKAEEKPFDPISNKLLSSIAATPAPQAPSEEPPESEPSPPALSLAHPAPASNDAPQKGPEQKAEAPKKASSPGKRPTPKRSALKKLTVVHGKGERLTKAVKCLFTPSEERELRNLVQRLSSE